MSENEWKWSKADEKGLARFVNEKAFEFLSKKWPDNLNNLELHQNPDGRKELIKVIYDTLISFDIQYAHNKYHPEEETQVIRPPSKILLGEKEGTCLDLALLFCGLCFNRDLLPLLIVIEGHALAAVSLNYQRQNDEWKKAFVAERNLFNNNDLFTGERNREKLLELINDGDYVALECTGFAHCNILSDLEQPEAKKREPDGSLKFDRAIDVGRQQLSNSKRPFKFAIDIAAAQYFWKIQPLQIPNFQTAEKNAKAIFRVNVEKQENGRVTGIEAKKVRNSRDIDSTVTVNDGKNIDVAGGRFDIL